MRPRYRWRTRLRRKTPWFIERLVSKGSKDCGCHEWYHEGAVAGLDIDRCLHCDFAKRPSHPDWEGENWRVAQRASRLASAIALAFLHLEAPERRMQVVPKTGAEGPDECRLLITDTDRTPLDVRVRATDTVVHRTAEEHGKELAMLIESAIGQRTARLDIAL